MSRIKDITNQTFGRVTALFYAWSNKRGHSVWFCACECGKAAFLRSNALLTKNTASCGCLRVQTLVARTQYHAKYDTEKVEYHAYMAAKGRCTNRRNRSYGEYGGRGIQFRFDSFEDFLAHVGPRPSPAYSLDRIDNDGHYEMGNLRWATKRVQANNRRAFHETLSRQLAAKDAEIATLKAEIKRLAGGFDWPFYGRGLSAEVAQTAERPKVIDGQEDTGQTGDTPGWTLYRWEREKGISVVSTDTDHKLHAPFQSSVKFTGVTAPVTDTDHCPKCHEYLHDEMGHMCPPVSVNFAGVAHTEHMFAGK